MFASLDRCGEYFGVEYYTVMSNIKLDGAFFTKKNFADVFLLRHKRKKRMSNLR